MLKTLGMHFQRSLGIGATPGDYDLDIRQNCDGIRLRNAVDDRHIQMK